MHYALRIKHYFVPLQPITNIETMFCEHLSAEVILFFILYGITGAVPLIAAIYLLLRRSNAIAPGITPPVRLRRWAASFFIVSALAHVWWFLFFIYSGDTHSLAYAVVATIDCVGMLITIIGTLFAMLQDRKRPVWPAVLAMIPYVVILTLFILYPNEKLLNIAIVYFLLLYVLFTSAPARASRPGCAIRRGDFFRGNCGCMLLTMYHFLK